MDNTILEQMLLDANNPAALMGLANAVIANGGEIHNIQLWTEYASWLRTQLVDGTIKGSIAQPADFAGEGGGEVLASGRIQPRLTGVSNRVDPYGRIPIVYGKRRIYPKVAGNPYTVQSSDVLYLRALFLVAGYIEYDAGATDDDIAENIRIGDATLEEIDDAGYLSWWFDDGGGSPYWGDATNMSDIYDSDVAEREIGVELTYNNWVGPFRCLQKADEIGVEVHWPEGYYQITDGDPAWLSNLGCEFDYREAGTSDSWDDLKTIANNQYSNPGDETLKMRYEDDDDNVDNTKVYEVRAKRKDPDHDPSSNVYGRTFWTTLRAKRDVSPIGTIKDESGTNIKLSVLALDVPSTDANQGALGEVSIEIHSKLQAWNGTSWATAAATSNPAWICVHMLTGPATHNALNAATANDDLDLASFKSWADFCTTKGYEFNEIFDERSTLNQALAKCLAAGRARLIHDGSQIAVVYDDELDPLSVAMLFGQEDMTGEEWGGNSEELPHAVLAKYLDPDNDYATAEEIVYAGWDSYNSGNSDRREELDLPGVTDSTQAAELAEYWMKSSQYRQDIFRFSTGIKGLRLTEGDIIRIGNDVFVEGIATGRVKSVTVDGGGDVLTATLDQKVTMEAAKSYEARFWRVSSNEEVLAAVDLDVGDQQTLTFTTAIDSDDAIAEGDQFIFGEVGDSGGLYIVNKVEFDGAYIVVECYPYAADDDIYEVYS